MATSIQSAPRSRLGQWLNERLGLQGIAYPVPEHANSLPYILGGITLTGFVILVESHLAIHTFPADGFASFDIFSCKYFSEEEATKFLMDKLGAERVEINRLERGRDFVKHYPRNVRKAAVIVAKERVLAH